MTTRRVTRAEDRLRRLLVMLPWLMEVEHVPLSDVAARFGMTEQEVVRDLELVAMQRPKPGLALVRLGEQRAAAEDRVAQAVEGHVEHEEERHQPAGSE